jgi:hypothetical protein
MSSRERDAKRRHGVCATQVHVAAEPMMQKIHSPRASRTAPSFARRATVPATLIDLTRSTLSREGRYVIASIKFIAPER